MSQEYYRGLLEGKTGLIVPAGPHDKWLEPVYSSFCTNGNLMEAIRLLGKENEDASIIFELVLKDRRTDIQPHWWGLISEAISNCQFWVVDLLLKSAHSPSVDYDLLGKAVEAVKDNDLRIVKRVLTDPRTDYTKSPVSLVNCLNRWPILFVELEKLRFDFSQSNNILLEHAMKLECGELVDRLMNLPSVQTGRYGDLIHVAANATHWELETIAEKYTGDHTLLGWALRACIPGSGGPKVRVLLEHNARTSINSYECVILASRYTEHPIVLEYILYHPDTDLKVVASAEFMDRVSAERGDIKFLKRSLDEVIKVTTGGVTQDVDQDVTETNIKVVTTEILGTPVEQEQASAMDKELIGALSSDLLGEYASTSGDLLSSKSIIDVLFELAESNSESSQEANLIAAGLLAGVQLGFGVSLRK